MSLPLFSVFQPKKLFLTFARFSLVSSSVTSCLPVLDTRFSADVLDSAVPGLRGTFADESYGNVRCEVPPVKTDGEGDERRPAGRLDHTSWMRCLSIS